MARFGRNVRRVVLVLVGLPLMLVLLLLAVANIGPGQAALASLVGWASGGTVVITDLSGRFPDRLHMGRIELRDKAGAWLRIEDAELDWWPLRYLREGVDVERLAARRVAVIRLPPPTEPTSGDSGGTYGGPVLLRALHIERLELDILSAGPNSPAGAALRVDGNAQMRGTDGAVALSLEDGAGGRYRLDGTRQGDELRAEMTVTEPANGMIARVAGTPDLGAVDARINVAGPLQALRTTLAVRAGPLQASGGGTIDAVEQGAELNFSMRAPAMTPAPQMSWAGLRVDGTMKGKFAAPDIDANLAIDAPSLGGAGARRITAIVRGTGDHVTAELQAETLQLPGPAPDALAGAPLVLRTEMRVDAPNVPLTFRLTHPLFEADGSAVMETSTGEVRLRVPELAHLAAIAGVDLQGRAAATLRAERAGTGVRVQVAADFGLTGGPAPAPALIGEAARLAGTMTFDQGRVALSGVRLEGAKIALSADGTAAPQGLDVDWTLALADLAALAPQLRGRLGAKGRLTGSADDAALDADLEGVVTAEGIAPANGTGPEQLTAKLHVKHVPRAPSGTLAMTGMLAGAPVAVDLAAGVNDGAARLNVRRAEWRSVTLAGALTLPPGSSWPDGKMEGGVTRLDDFSALLGQRLTGSLTFSIAGGPASVAVKAEARDAGMETVGRAGRVWVDGKISDPAGGVGEVDGELGVDGAAMAGLAGSVRLAMRGPLAAVQTRLTANLTNLSGAPAQVAAVAEVDAVSHVVNLATATVGWRGENLRLLGPARINLADGVRVERMRLGLRDAELAVNGQATPRLDLTATVRNLPLDLLAVIAPGTAVDGRLSAEAKLGGTTASPTGQITLQASGVRSREGAARAMPPADLSGTVRLAGAAQVDLRMAAGRAANLTVSGQAPIAGAGPLNLQLGGNIDMTLLDPVLTPAGRRARGRLDINAAIGGSMAVPRLSGSAAVANGELQDFGLGARIDHISGRISADGTSVRLADLRGRAGNGTVALAGTIGVFDAGMPVDITVTAKGARPLASDRMNAVLDAALTLRGQAAGAMTVQGKLDVQQASIRVPERLPITVATLNVRRPGQRPQAVPVAPPQAAPPGIALDVAVSGRQMALSGRGINAEFGGDLRLRGSLAAPRPEGAFKLRRGDFSLAGKTLTFDKGEISFNGGALTDPSLDLTASSTSGNVTAMVKVTGTAQKPDFKLTSTPELPQDEVLARLLFGRSASSLSPIELAQIAATLASLSGVGPSGGSPLEALQRDLGLDRLSVGSSPAGDPTVSAGRYVAPGVYVGGKQGAGGTGATQGSVQIDLTDRLKLEGTFGPSTGSGSTSTTQSVGSGIGLTYQFEY